MTPRADLMIVDARPWSEGGAVRDADTIAITDGRVLAIGRRAALADLAGPATETLDARGATVTPGLTDAHLHLVAWARSRAELSLFDCPSRSEALERVATHLAAHPGPDPVVGRGWDAAGWAELPDRASLDGVTGNRPVVLHGKDFHSLWVNGAALRSAGIAAGTPDPPGGRFERDAAGEPTGVVREHAVRAFAGLLPAVGGERDEHLVRDAIRALHTEGITGVHDFEGADEHRLLRAITRGAGPRVRVLMHLHRDGLDHALALGLASGTGDDWFRIGALKLFADGTLGSQTAALLEPYEGTTDRGMELLAPGELAGLAKRAAAGGLATAVHAIGDRAVRAALDAFQSCREVRGGPALPPRIEHVQLLDPEDAPRFAALGVAASMQPLHCTADIDLACRHWGGRVDRCYPWRTLAERGVLLAFGSDAPVEPPGTAAALHAAVTRRRSDGTPRAGFVPAQRVTLDQALTAYTAGPARLSGAWPRIGRLAPGATADLAVWSADLHAIEADDLSRVRVAATILGGEVVHRADPGPRGATAGIAVSGARGGDR